MFKIICLVHPYKWKQWDEKTENQPTPISYSLAKWSLEGSVSTANHGYDYHSVSFHSRVSCDSQLEIPCPKSIN